MHHRTYAPDPPNNPPILETEDLASVTECTGLTPAAIQTQAQAENYSELYAIHEQKPAWEHNELGASESGRHSKRAE